MMIDVQSLVADLGRVWRGNRMNLPCPVCQPERRKDQNALSLRNDGGRLLAFCHKSGCSFHDIARAAGLPPGIMRADADARHKAGSKRASDDLRREAQAKAIWGEAVPVAGTLAETYLVGRGISCTLPDSLRFHPAGWHATGNRLPMLVARVDGESFAVHRTYLRADGRGKAELDPPKAMLGPCAGGAVRLSDGAGPLVVCEGIETGLSLLSGLLSAPAVVRAALSTSGMRGLILPPVPGRLTIASDGDAAGREAAYALASRAEGLGWRVSLLPAPDGRDWNDILCLKAGKGGQK
jgi:Toprim domain